MNTDIGESSLTTFWCAIQVAPRHEMTVSKILSNKGYEQFTPTYRVRRQWSDRIKHLEYPLFPGYVFCRIQRGVAGPIYTTPGVMRIVSYGGSIGAVEDYEIDNLRKATGSGRALSPSCWTQGQKIRIVRGPLAGITGTLRCVANGYQLILSIDLLMKAVSVAVDATDVTADIAETLSTSAGSIN
jgi:transcription antitermination factor NusG